MLLAVLPIPIVSTNPAEDFLVELVSSTAVSSDVPSQSDFATLVSRTRGIVFVPYPFPDPLWCVIPAAYTRISQRARNNASACFINPAAAAAAPRCADCVLVTQYHAQAASGTSPSVVLTALSKALAPLGSEDVGEDTPGEAGEVEAGPSEEPLNSTDAFSSVLFVTAGSSPSYWKPPSGSMGLYLTLGCRTEPPEGGRQRIIQALPPRGCRTVAGVTGEVLGCQDGLVRLRECPGPEMETRLESGLGTCFSGGWLVEGTCPGNTETLRIVLGVMEGDATFRDFFRIGVAEAAETMPSLVRILRVLPSHNWQQSDWESRRGRALGKGGIEVWFEVHMQDDPASTLTVLSQAFADPSSSLYSRFLPISPLTRLGNVARAPIDDTTEVPTPVPVRTEKETHVAVYILLGIAGFCCCWSAVVLVASWTAPTRADYRARKHAEDRRQAEEASGMHDRTTLV